MLTTILPIAFLLMLSAIPLAVCEIRWTRRYKARLRDRAFIERTLEAPLPPPRRKLDRFIRQHVSVTRFGDQRRRTAALAEVMAPETGPIDLV